MLNLLTRIGMKSHAHGLVCVLYRSIEQAAPPYVATRRRCAVTLAEKMRISIPCLALLLMAGCSSVMPTTRWSYHGGDMYGITANSNTSQAVNAEIHSAAFAALLYARTGKSVSLTGFSAKMSDMDYSTEWQRAYPPEVETLVERYVAMRAEGHSKTYAMARLQTDPDVRSLTPDGQAILNEDQDAYMPWLWLFSFQNDGGTNYTTYLILDGEITWSYMIARRNDRSLLYCVADAFDSKDVLPQYKAIFTEVEKLVEREMRADGSWGQFGSCHGYWARKKELLRERGIIWRTPQELHPSTCYD